MRYTAAILLGLMLTGAASSGQAQTDDGWDFAVNGDVTVASAEYASGQTLAARCKDKVLSFILIGLPIETGATRLLDIDVGEGFHRQTWLNVPDQPMASAVRAGMVARSLRHGGEFQLKTYPSVDHPEIKRYALPLPSDSANLDRVLAACGTPLEDVRDERREIEPPLAAPPNTLPDLWASLGRPDFPSAAQRAGQENGSTIISCLVGERGSLSECRAEMETPPGFGFGATAAAMARTGRLKLGPGVEPGMILVSVTRFQLQ